MEETELFRYGLNMCDSSLRGLQQSPFCERDKLVSHKTVNQQQQK